MAPQQSVPCPVQSSVRAYSFRKLSLNGLKMLLPCWAQLCIQSQPSRCSQDGLSVRGLAPDPGVGNSPALTVPRSLQSQGSESLLWGCRALVSWSSGRALLSPLHIILGDMWPRASHATAARSPSPVPYAPRNSGFVHPVPLTSPLGCPKGLVELSITSDESCFPESSPRPTHSTLPSPRCSHSAVLAARSPFPPTLIHWHVLFGPCSHLYGISPGLRVFLLSVQT